MACLIHHWWHSCHVSQLLYMCSGEVANADSPHPTFQVPFLQNPPGLEPFLPAEHLPHFSPALPLPPRGGGGGPASASKSKSVEFAA